MFWDDALGGSIDFIREHSDYISPWLSLAETSIREGELTAGDWVNAIGNTMRTLREGSQISKGALRELLTSDLPVDDFVKARQRMARAEGEVAHSAEALGARVPNSGNAVRATETLIKHKAGNQQILVGGKRWNLPTNSTIDDIPMNDSVGDTLQNLTSDAASRWNTSQLSINEQLAIAEAKEAEEYWRANLLQAQAKGRWVENEVRSATQSMDNIEWSRVGVDVTDLDTGVKYDILSGTKSNIDTHAKRMSDELFWMITF